MTAQLIRWQGPTRSEALRSAVSLRVQHWLQQWAVAPDDLHVCLQEASVSDIAGWHSAHAVDGACALVGLSRTELAQLGSLLAGAPLRIAADSELARAVGSGALKALFADLLDEPCEIQTVAEVPMSAASARHGWVALQVRSGAMDLVLLIDPVLCDRIDPPRRAATALQPRHTALAASQATLTARLDLGSVDVALVSSLRPGDVLRTSVPLDALLSLSAGHGPVVSRGRLALLDQHKAITVDSSL